MSTSKISDIKRSIMEDEGGFVFDPNTCCWVFTVSITDSLVDEALTGDTVRAFQDWLVRYRLRPLLAKHYLEENTRYRRKYRELTAALTAECDAADEKMKNYPYADGQVSTKTIASIMRSPRQSKRGSDEHED